VFVEAELVCPRHKGSRTGDRSTQYSVLPARTWRRFIGAASVVDGLLPQTMTFLKEVLVRLKGTLPIAAEVAAAVRWQPSRAEGRSLAVPAQGTTLRSRGAPTVP
jgi:hypothetical protein